MNASWSGEATGVLGCNLMGSRVWVVIGVAIMALEENVHGCKVNV